VFGKLKAAQRSVDQVTQNNGRFVSVVRHRDIMLVEPSSSPAAFKLTLLSDWGGSSRKQETLHDVPNGATPKASHQCHFQATPETRLRNGHKAPSRGRPSRPTALIAYPHSSPPRQFLAIVGALVILAKLGSNPSAESGREKETGAAHVSPPSSDSSFLDRNSRGFRFCGIAGDHAKLGSCRGSYLDSIECLAPKNCHCPVPNREIKRLI